eukprot:EG_transcript_13554
MPPGPRLWLALLMLVAGAQAFLINTSGTAWDHPGWACLRRNTPSLELRYPDDAEEHFRHIHAVMRRWAQPPGHRPHQYIFEGPWVENLWIDRARELNSSRFRPPRFGPWTPLPLSAVFGPFIPLLLTWVDTWVAHGRYPPDFLPALRSVLRRDVPYVTVSQHDEGITGRCELLLSEYPNILVFSAGGYGHIPIPLFMQNQPLSNTKPMEERRYLVSYVGSLEHAGSLRPDMKTIVEAVSAELNFSSTIYHGPEWASIMAVSCVSLVPRGFGRTAFHLAEVIQMGLIPIYIYTDVPWLPYGSLYHKVGFAANLTTLPALLRRLARTERRVLAQREAAVGGVRDLFLPPGVLREIFAYIIEQRSHLRCVRLPKTPRGVETCS